MCRINKYPFGLRSQFQNTTLPPETDFYGDTRIERQIQQTIPKIQYFCIQVHHTIGASWSILCSIISNWLDHVQSISTWL